MLEILIQNLGKSIILSSVALASIFNSGCSSNTLKTMPEESIVRLDPKHEQDLNLDYNKLNWKEAIEYINSPRDVQGYLDRHFEYKIRDRVESFALNHINRKGKCIDYAVAAAALLSDNGYKPNILLMASNDNSKSGHAVFVYRTSEGFGAIGSTLMPPVYKNIESLVKGFEKQYGWKFNRFLLIDLDEMFPGRKWVTTKKDISITNDLYIMNKVR